MAPATIFQLDDDVKMTHVQQKPVFEFCVCLFSQASNMQYTSLVMPGRGSDHSSPVSPMSTCPQPIHVRPTILYPFCFTLTTVFIKSHVVFKLYYKVGSAFDGSAQLYADLNILKPCVR